jgi:hypothetical protein
MSFGSHTKRPYIPPPPPTLVNAPEIKASKESLLEKIRRMQGRAETELVGPGFLLAEDKRKGLRSTLG